MPPTEPGATGPARGASGAGDTGALQQRVTALQQQLAESQRLLDLKNAELANLQKQLGAGKPGQPAVVAPAEPTKSPQEVLQESSKGQPETTGAAPEATPPAAVPTPAKPSTAPAVPAAKVSGSILDWLIENWILLLGALALILAALFGWRYMRSRQEQEFGRTLDRLSTPPFEASSRQSVRPAETQPMRTLSTKQDSSFVVEESGSHQAPRISEGDLANMQSVPVADDDSVAGDTAVALDQGDPLAEADFHMAYGLYDQAADLVRIAITREPQRRDLKLKLLEVFFVWGNKDQFLQLARELSTTREEAASGEWEKVVIMGRQIAPDDSLFTTSGALSGAGAGGVDLNLEGGQNRVDFDLLGEPSIAQATPSDAVDLDLGSALGESDATGELRAIGDTGVDFVLDDPARGGDGSTGSTREMPQSHTVTLDIGDGAHDTPTVENLQPQDLDSPTIRQKLESSARTHLASADQTAELAIDDLGLDVAGADTGKHHAMDVASSPTMLTSLDEDTRELLARAQAQGQAEVVMPDTNEMPAPSTGASGTWLFTDKDFSAVMPAVGAAAETPTELVTAVVPGPDSTMGVTAQVEELKGRADSIVDLDLDSLEVTGERSTGLDLDVGQSTPATEAAFAATQRLNAPEPVATDAEPATMSEVGTKLDLARAYMDMGDPEGARSILEEVLAEGSVSQKTEARRLIDSLPG